MNVFTIPPGASFVNTLALSLLEKTGGDPLALARMQILLPTRRSCRALRDAFLRNSEGAALLLPVMQPIGDVDEDELILLTAATEAELSLKPAISPLQRQFLLTRLVSRLGRGKNLAQDMALADALGKLMDQVYTENLDLADLPGIIDNADFSEHWQVSIEFLSILSVHWPQILSEKGVMDAADRRNRLMLALADVWRMSPPSHPVIAAGSTGSIPAAASLLKIIAAMPDGAVILPGLDQDLDDESWTMIGPTHPQTALKSLLERLDIDRKAVRLWLGPRNVAEKKNACIFVSEIMRPAETTDRWQNLTNDPAFTPRALSMERYDCASPQEEAMVIALAMRRTLQETAKTAALVTPDRRLARRVAMTCRRWGLDIDDSAGQDLSHTRIGTYIRLCLCTVQAEFKAVSLLSFCKHALCAPLPAAEWRALVRIADQHLLRGPALSGGFPPLREKLGKLREKRLDKEELFQDIGTFLRELETGFSPLTEESGRMLPFADWCDAHLRTLEYFCPPHLLWSGEEGESAALFFTDLRENAGILPSMTFDDYTQTVETAMAKITVRKAYGAHPRLSILGQLEARLVDFDVMILGGLNEGTWPSAPPADPWMSRPMRKRFGLPAPERAIGLSAHDFSQCLCADRVVLTRATRVDGTPMVPSRWLQRIDTVSQASGHDGLLQGGDLIRIARALDSTGKAEPTERPAPKPPVAARPRRLSVTEIETWMKDPYGIYARRILDLEKLDPLERPFDAAVRGTILHDVMKEFVHIFPDKLPPDKDIAIDTFIDIAERQMAAMVLPEDVRLFWMPRLYKIAEWIVETEAAERQAYKPFLTETKGTMVLKGPAGDFTLTARADRIDLARDGSDAIVIDYKSAGTYTSAGMQDGRHPQLPLEGVMLEEGAFGDSKKVAGLMYWSISGAGEGGKTTGIDSSRPSDLEDALLNARQGLQDLIDSFDREDTPYHCIPRADKAPRYNNYAHLGRVQEWASSDDGDET